MVMTKKLKITIIAAVIVVAVFSIGAIKYTSQVGFCNSCHEMNVAFAGWEEGVHSDMHCYECHTDEGLISTVKVKANGLKEVYIHFTQEVDMDKVQSEVPSSRCVKCHDFSKEENFKTVPQKRIAAFHTEHAEYKLDCITCHISVGHTGKAFVGFGNEACQKCHQANNKA